MVNFLEFSHGSNQSCDAYLIWTLVLIFSSTVSTGRKITLWGHSQKNHHDSLSVQSEVMWEVVERVLCRASAMSSCGWGHDTLLVVSLHVGRHFSLPPHNDWYGQCFLRSQPCWLHFYFFREMLQSVKCLLHKPEDLVLFPRIHVKQNSWTQQHMPVIQVLGR